MSSVFESWMVNEYHQLGLGYCTKGSGEPEARNAGLSEIFGLMSTLNGVVAILAGIVAQIVTDAIGSQLAPFGAAVCCLGLAFILILRKWVSL